MNSNWIFCFCDFETTGIDYDESLPIEVGCVFTNAKFDVLNTYESMIMWPKLSKVFRWPDWAEKAYEFHHITIQEYLEKAMPNDIVCDKIAQICRSVNFVKENRNVILISDNAAFEFNFMRRMFKQAKMEFPFHYCAWDTSLLLEITGVCDPPGKHVLHRALADASQLHKYVIRSLERVGYFDKK